jgi:hypothetical protein
MKPKIAKVGVGGSNPLARSNFLLNTEKQTAPLEGPLSLEAKVVAAYQGQDG